MPERDGHESETAALREQIEQLKEAITSHAVIDQAIGVVIAFGGVDAETAWEILREISQHANIKLREVAAQVVQWPCSTELLPEIRAALDVALKSRETPHSLVSRPLTESPGNF
ncbi:ANTAR domain-containing protein [Streptomyces sp. NPDC051452]|uniref:ANTAR domain-containing protein n=1 Tax=Streptomyces sp. NPDC051452 TaxID=3365654 RepID=UPI00379B2DCC